MVSCERRRLVSSDVVFPPARVLLNRTRVEDKCSIINVVARRCFAKAYLHTTPTGLRGHLVLQTLNPCQRTAIEIACEDSNRLYRTVYTLGPTWFIVHHMTPQGREDPASSADAEFAFGAGRAVVVTYMKWHWRVVRGICRFELQILSHAQRVLLYATAYIIVSRQDESIRIPDEYVMSIRLAFPRRPFSTAVEF